MTLAEALTEAAQRYAEYQAKWVAHFGTTDGFNAWFSKQLGL